MDYNKISETLQNLINVRPKQREIADILGLRVNVIGQRASRKSNFPVEDIKKIGKHYGVDLINDTVLNPNYDSLEQKTDNKEDCIVADYYPEVFGSCGSGAFVFSETSEKIQVPVEVIKHYSRVKKYSVINAIGDSMMPYIHDKDLLIVEHYNGEQIRDNRIYVFRFGDNIFIKRLVFNINQLVIESDNKNYDVVKISGSDLSEIQIIGQIVGLMRGTRW